MKEACRTIVGYAIVLFAVLATASSAQAAPLAYDGFAVANGGTGESLTTSPSPTGYSNADSSGWSGSWTAGSNPDGTMTSGLSVPASATAYSYSPAGGAVLENGNSASALDYRQFSSSDVNQGNSTTGQLWVSFLVQRGSSSVSRFTALSLFDGTGTEVLDIGANSPNFSSGNPEYNNWQIIGNGTGGTQIGTATVNNSGAAVSSQSTATALLVAEVAFNGSGSATAYLWVNPTSSTDFTNPSTAYEQVTGLTYLDTTGVDTVRIFAGGLANNSATFDEIRLGTTVADVVPEPSTAAIALGAVAGMLMRRRSRRARTAAVGAGRSVQ